MRFNRFKKPKLKSERTVARFALFPTKIGKYIIWLERYYERQVYDNYFCFFCESNSRDHWRAYDVVTEGEYLDGKRFKKRRQI